MGRAPPERGWGATMVLTEPDAGSDVGAGRTKAVKAGRRLVAYRRASKRFITSADSDDMFENIPHLVLARPEGAGPGTRVLSLFFVPKFHFDRNRRAGQSATGDLCHQRRTQDGPQGLGHLQS